MSRLLGLPPNDPIIEIELNDIRANLQAELELGESSWADCFKNGPNKALFRTLTGTALQACVSRPRALSVSEY